MSNEDLNSDLLKRTPIFNLKVWVLIAICFSIVILLILLILYIWSSNRRRKPKRAHGINNDFNYNSAQSQIPTISKEITVDRVGGGNRTLAQSLTHPLEADKEQPCKTLAQLALNNHNNSVDYDNMSQCSSNFQTEKIGSSHSGEEPNGSVLNMKNNYSPFSPSPLVGLPEFSQLGWGHWFTLRDLEYATNQFSKDNVLGEGGYGVVYHGRLVNGSEVAIKRIFNNM
jgi:hypothetical protein